MHAIVSAPCKALQTEGRRITRRAEISPSVRTRHGPRDGVVPRCPHRIRLHRKAICSKQQHLWHYCSTQHVKYIAPYSPAMYFRLVGMVSATSSSMHATCAASETSSALHKRLLHPSSPQGTFSGRGKLLTLLWWRSYKGLTGVPDDLKHQGSSECSLALAFAQPHPSSRAFRLTQRMISRNPYRC